MKPDTMARVAPKHRTPITVASLLVAILVLSWSKSLLSPIWPGNKAAMMDAASKTGVGMGMEMMTTIESIPFGSLGPSGSTRQNLRYYDTLFALTLQFGKNAKNILEIGCADVPFIGQLPWIESRVCVAPYNVLYKQRGDKKERGHPVEMITADFFEWEANKRYDLVVCSQVVEHVKDPRTFVQKLLEVADTAIISVPYKWAQAQTSPRSHHISHDIDEQVFLQWASPRKPAVTAIVAENSQRPGLTTRIIMVFTSDK